MGFASTKILAVLAAILALAIPFSASACSCTFDYPLPGTFLHLSGDGRITLPANALGVLYLKPAQLDVHSDDRNGTVVLKSLPPKLDPAYFNVFDEQAGRAVEAVLTPVDIDAQLGRPRSYYLFKEGVMPAGRARESGAALRAAVKKYGLRDVSAQVKSAVGLFRLAPAGGFIEGHRYSILPGTVGMRGGHQAATIVVGPPLRAGGTGKILLALARHPQAELLTVAAGSMCSAKAAVLVGRLEYRLPERHKQYQNLLMTFTFEQFLGRQLNNPARTPGRFMETTYRADTCSRGALLGTSAAGPGKELILAQCPKLGEQADPRLVRGYAGILEIDQALQPVAGLTVPFDQSGSVHCWLMGLGHDS